MDWVSEPFTVRQQPRSSTPLSELKLLVRTPGDPNGYQAFTEAQRAEADTYAQERNATVEELL